MLPRLTAAAAGLIAIEEAVRLALEHGFRPDYRRIRRLVETLPRGIPVLATTATANARVATTSNLTHALQETSTQRRTRRKRMLLG